MRIGWITDPHLNFVMRRPAAYDALLRQIAAGDVEALIISGDVAEADTLEPHLVRLARESELPCWFVLGNHDFYGGSVAEVRALTGALASREAPALVWLHGAEPLALSHDTALVGVDGWGDARLGAPERSSVLLNDFYRIAELRAAFERGELIAELRSRGDAEAEALAAPLAAALASHRRVIVATHVPPFAQATWHEGALSDDNWLPFFSCGATGDALCAAAARHPDREIVVLCGHTHSGGFAQIAPNLAVHTGPSRYGAPALVGVVHLEPSGVRVERRSEHWTSATT